MKTRAFDKLWIGALAGLLLPVLVVLAYHQISFPHLSVGEFISRHWNFGVFAPLMSLAVFLNLGLFFLFYWKNLNYAARGVILSTLLYAAYIFYLKLS